VTAGSYSSVTVDAKGRVTAGSKNAVLEHGSVTSSTLTTAATTANQVVVSTLASATRTLKVSVQVTSGSSYQASELLVIHDGTTASVVEYGNVMTGSVLASFDADINSGNLRVVTTPVNATTTYKAVVTTINA